MPNPSLSVVDVKDFNEIEIKKDVIVSLVSNLFEL